MNDTASSYLYNLVMSSLGHFEHLVWLEPSFQALFIGIAYMVKQYIAHNTAFPEPLMQF